MSRAKHQIWYVQCSGLCCLSTTFAPFSCSVNKSVSLVSPLAFWSTMRPGLFFHSCMCCSRLFTRQHPNSTTAQLSHCAVLTIPEFQSHSHCGGLRHVSSGRDSERRWSSLTATLASFPVSSNVQCLRKALVDPGSIRLRVS